MLNLEEINRIVEGVARKNLSGEAVDRVFSESAVDSEGQEAVRITIVLAHDAAERDSGDATLDTLFDINNELQKAGEDRFPIIEYATEEELSHSGDD